MGEKTVDYNQPLDQGGVVEELEKKKKIKDKQQLAEIQTELETKLGYKVTPIPTKGGMGFRRIFDESVLPLSEFVSDKKTVDTPELPLDQGGVVNKCSDNPASLSDFVRQNNKKEDRDKGILIIRAQGGIGDILNTRMIFEDIKKMAGKRKITYAVPRKYIPLLTDHPYIDNIIATQDIVRQDYIFVKDITDQCGKYESKTVPNVDKHRSDIWANYIGLDLSKHNQHISFTKEEGKNARKITDKARLKIAIHPISSSLSKDWGLDKWQELINLIKATYKKAEIFCYHDKPIDELQGIIGMYDLSLREWMASVNECDAVITVATSTYCLANGLHKPTVAIFGSENLDVYGKYFPEMIPIQRHRDRDEGWDECPCWQAWNNCHKLNVITIDNQKIPPCLASISVDEVMKGFKKCLKKM